MRKFGIAVIVLGILGGVGFLGLIPFEGDRLAPEQVYDGIVVLTGGDGRIEQGFRLLEQGQGHRLLISGVGGALPVKLLKRRFRLSEADMRCCVTFGLQAHNTIENALEVRAWQQEYGIRSLLLVTANYHMPRSQSLLAHYNPELTIHTYPVFPIAPTLHESLQSRSFLILWWMEYLKSMQAQLHMLALGAGA